ncbi:MAG: aldo/keto reductase, partial [Planctomycetota bacterium]
MVENADRSQGWGRRDLLRTAAAGVLGFGLAGALPRHLLADEKEPQGKPPPAKKEPGVAMRVLGRTKAPVSVITFGCGALRPERSRMLQVAYDLGIRDIDVAQNYQNGRAEEAVGAFLSSFPHRDRLFVSTKASHFRKPRGGSAKAVLAAFRENVQSSLRKLETDYVDLFLWPHGTADTGFLKDEAVRDAMRRVRDEKLVRHFGFSSHANYRAVCEAALDDGFYDAILTVLNICTQNADVVEEAPAPAGGGGKGKRGRKGKKARRRRVEDTRGILRLAQEKNVGILAMKVAKAGYVTPAADALLAKEFPNDTSLT